MSFIFLWAPPFLNELELPGGQGQLEHFLLSCRDLAEEMLIGLVGQMGHGRIEKTPERVRGLLCFSALLLGLTLDSDC